MQNAVTVVQSSALNGHGGLYCPSPKANMSVWDNHPKVFLDVAKTGEAKCPYCGEVYRLQSSEASSSSHV